VKSILIYDLYRVISATLFGHRITCWSFTWAYSSFWVRGTSCSWSGNGPKLRRTKSTSAP